MNIILPVEAPIVSGWTVAHHIPRTDIVWNPEKIRFVTDGKHGELYADKMPAGLVRESHLLLNACMLEYLLEHPELVLDEWALFEYGIPSVIGFYGTQYMSGDGSHYVRGLCIHPDKPRRLEEVGHWIGYGTIKPHRAILLD